MTAPQKGSFEVLMKIKDVIAVLNAEVLSGENRLEEEVKWVGAADMMSDVLSLGRPGMVILTGNNSLQALRSSVVTEILALVLIRNKPVGPEVIEFAKKNNFILLRTAHYLFATCGKLYQQGFRGIDEKPD